MVVDDPILRHYGPVAPAVERLVDELAATGAVRRLWGADHTFWSDDPTEISDRLGWLDAPWEMLDRAGELHAFAAGLASNGFTHAVVMGMGGSSLFPEVAARTFGDGSGALDLHVVDTTDPAAILRIEETLPLRRTLFVAASKSGTTIEARSQLAYFWERVGRADQFVAITDPGTPLAALARNRGFRAVFENRPDVGGRYSALTHFGLVPAALAGVDLEELLSRASTMADKCRNPEDDNPGVQLGAVMGACARAGRYALTLRLPGPIAAFGAWIEQLVAESTGKQGTGILPVDGEPPRAPSAYGDERLFAVLGPGLSPGLNGDHGRAAALEGPDGRADRGGTSTADVAALAEAGHPVVTHPYDDPYALGAEVVRWEVATAVAGHVLGINPFDQPDVQAAKDATSRVLAGEQPAIETAPLGPHLETVRPGDYVAVQAFVDPGGPDVDALRRATAAIGERLGVPATFGLGPRYLHSTGQFHKGGPPRGVFVQVVGDDSQDLPVPGAGYGFSELKRAQAAGDYEALADRGLRVARVDPGEVLDAAP